MRRILSTSTTPSSAAPARLARARWHLGVARIRALAPRDPRRRIDGPPRRPRARRVGRRRRGPSARSSPPGRRSLRPRGGWRGRGGAHVGVAREPQCAPPRVVPATGGGADQFSTRIALAL